MHVLALLTLAAALPLRSHRDAKLGQAPAELLEEVVGIDAMPPAREPQLAAVVTHTQVETLAVLLVRQAQGYVGGYQVWKRNMLDQYGVAGLAATTMLYEAIFLGVTGMIWAFVCMGQDRAYRRAAREDLKGGDFQPVGLFHCFKWQAVHVCEACMCYQFMWAETVSKMQILPFWAVLATVCVAIVLGTVTAGITVVLLMLARFYVRTVMRRELGQSTAGGSTCMDSCYDILVHLFCFPCAVSQEAEFVEHCDHHGLLNV